MDKKVLASRALKEVNAIRKQYGLPRLTKLRKGMMGASSYCPIANSLRELGSNVYVGHTVISFYKGGMCSSNYHNMSTPDDCRKFISKFDRELLPEYIKGANR